MTSLSDIACPACGCLCDDLRATVESNRIAQLDGACDYAKQWYELRDDAASSPATIDGKPVSLVAALARAAELLRGSSYPLITGLHQSDTQGVRAAIALAEAIGATIDPAAAASDAAWLWAMQQVGISTATLGEIRNRADFVLFWGVDPMVTHPRLWERFVDSPGHFVPGGRSDRRVVVVDEAPTLTSEIANQFMAISPVEALDRITLMRSIVRSDPMAKRASVQPPQEPWVKLADEMKSCRTGVVFFSFHSLPLADAEQTAEALLLLVRELNEHARFYARPLMSSNLIGAENVLAWQTGFPLAVNFSSGAPRSYCNEYSADTLLSRGEPDICMLIGSDGVERFSPLARAHLESIPIILLDASAPPPLRTADVHISTATCGVHTAGTAYRLDDVPLPLRPLRPSPLPSDAEILRGVLRSITLREAPGAA
jgi:formylmethanofuran dehydrogenase subunit B